MEPVVAYCMDVKKWQRSKAVRVTAMGVFVLGIPCAFSFGILQNFTLLGHTFFEFLVFLCLHVLIPLGGLAALVLMGWQWGINNSLQHLKIGAEGLFKQYSLLEIYFRISLKYIATLAVILIMLDALGLF